MLFRGTCVLLVLLTPAGAWARQRVRAEFQVNTYTTGGQHTTAVAAGPDGRFVVLWASDGQDGSGVGVFGQRYAANGNRLGAEFRVNTYTTGHQSWFAYENPAVAVGQSTFVAVWGSEDQDGSYGGIYGQRFDLDGAPLGAEFRVNDITTELQGYPSLAMCPDQSFVVSWHDYGNDGDRWGVFARRFDASGSPRGAQFVVTAYTSGSALDARVACASNGDFLVVWRTGSSPYSIRGQEFDAAGQRLGAERVISAGPGLGSVSPRIAARADGYLALWEEYTDFKLMVQRLDAQAEPLGSALNVGRLLVIGVGISDVAANAAGQFVVSWTYGPHIDVRAQRFDPAGQPVGADFFVNSVTAGWQEFPALAMDRAGNFVVSYDSFGYDTIPSQDGSWKGAFARRFSALEPVSLRLDTGGNGVLDPGEEVDLRPVWRNVGTVEQDFSAALDGFDGPLGASYKITDGGGGYVPISPGATIGCADCYQVSVSEPHDSRPAMHWDASVVETLSSDTQNVEKEWLLHVGRTFTDVDPASPYYPWIEGLVHHSVTPGCGPRLFCPTASTRRDEMAGWLLLAREGGDYVPQDCRVLMFSDVPRSNSYCAYVQELVRRGIAGGCGYGRYCPEAPVSREQMAVLLLRTLDPALDPPACSPPNLFADVPETSPYCRFIEELANRGVVAGCGGGNYCPTEPVTREQMAVLVSRTFELSVYGP